MPHHTDQYHANAVASLGKVLSACGMPPTLVPGWYVQYPGRKWSVCSAQRAADLLARAWDGVRVAHVEATEE